jgi:predicted nuclease of predicted toxin-antitoxin system
VKRPKTKLKFFLDEGVPDSVAKVLRDAGHEAVLLRESGVARGSPDQLVCAYAEVTEAILIAIDGDMKQLARSHGAGAGRFKRLNLVKLSCFEPNASTRIMEAMSLILHEWRAGEGRTRRIHIEIGDSFMRTMR